MLQNKKYIKFHDENTVEVLSLGSLDSGIEKGDSVITAGGLHGKVTGLTDDVITLEIAALKGERVRVKVSRAKVDGVVKPGQSESS